MSSLVARFAVGLAGVMRTVGYGELTIRNTTYW
jgi:hypothetical protein